jgi:alkylated DNA repair dioxygenase AlkB
MVTLNSEVDSDYEIMNLLPHGHSWYVSISKIPESIILNDEVFEELWNLHPPEFGEGMIFGKIRKFPRWNMSYGQDYKFSGKLNIARKINHSYLKKLVEWVSRHSGKDYKQILINWYQDGGHYIGWHSDDEKQLVKNSPIYSFSFGQGRAFKIKSIDGKFNETMNMCNNSLIIMGGEMQKYYKHSVPKRALSKVSKRRINITLRLFK